MERGEISSQVVPQYIMHVYVCVCVYVAGVSKGEWIPLWVIILLSLFSFLSESKVMSVKVFVDNLHAS